MKKNIFFIASIFFVLMFSAVSVSAQELKCKVTINTAKLHDVDFTIFKNLENYLNEFMNQRAWTQDNFAPEEKIDCNFFIVMESATSQDNYKATLTIQSSRSVFNSTYNSPILNFKDADFGFYYSPNTPLDFNVNQYNSNITSVLGFWTYIVLGLDYESMAKGGGQKYFTNAETILNTAPQSGEESKGWQAFDSNPVTGNRNRYQMVFSLMGGKFNGFKDAVYDYHFKGLDNFYDNPTAARSAMVRALETLDKTFKDYPSNVLINSFLFAKSDELVNVFSQADQNDKVKVIGILKRLDPANGPKYDKILRG